VNLIEAREQNELREMAVGQQIKAAELASKKAEMLLQLAEALTKLSNLNVDITPLLREYKLIPKAGGESIELRAYHLEYGLLTINEARARIGLTPVKNGDEFVAPRGSTSSTKV
jgi:hypothetical protein